MEQDRLGMNIAHIGHAGRAGHWLGINWAEEGRMEPALSAQDNGTEEDRWEDDGARSRMARARGATAATPASIKAHGILLRCEMKPMEMTWAPQRTRTMGVFLVLWSPSRNVFSGEKQLLPL